MSFCWDFLPRCGCPFRWGESSGQFLCRELVTSLRQWGGLLLPSASNHFSSTAANSVEECRTSQRFPWRRLLPGSNLQKHYLFYGLLFLGDRVFPIVASVFADDLWFFGVRRSVTDSWRVIESEGWPHESLRMFEFIEEGGGSQRGGTWRSVLDDSGGF